MGHGGLRSRILYGPACGGRSPPALGPSMRFSRTKVSQLTVSLRCGIGGGATCGHRGSGSARTGRAGAHPFRWYVTGRLGYGEASGHLSDSGGA
eukprot:2078379-Amphidinium_carterae.1